MLTPIAVDPPNPFPFIANRGISMIVDLWRPTDDKHIHGLVPITGPINRFLRLPGPRQRYLPIEQVVAMFFDRLFPGFEVAGHGVFRVIRDSDLEIEEEAEDLVRLFESAIKRRRRGQVVRLTIDGDMPDELKAFLMRQLVVEPENVFRLRS